MQFDLRKFIVSGTKPYAAEFQCDLSAKDFAGARIEQPVTARFEAVPDGEEIRMTLRANALVHGECARCLDPVEREETVQAEWTVRERDLDDPDFDLPLNEKGHLLCSADCPGLCPRCGKKMAECTCPPAEAEAEPADARLAILKSLLN